MAKQTQLFPAEQMQEDIISMENIEAPSEKVNVVDTPNLLETVEQEPKEVMEPIDIAAAGKIGVFSKDLGDVFKLSKEKVKKKEELEEPKPVREFIGEEEKTIAPKENIQTQSPILEQAAETTVETQERQKYINPTVQIGLNIL